MTDQTSQHKPEAVSAWRAHPLIRVRLAVSFVDRFLNFMLTPLMAILLATSYGTATAGLMLLVVVAATIVCTFVGGHVSDARGRRPTLLLAEGGVVVAYAGMFLANSPWWHSPALTFGCFLLNSCMGGLGFPASDAVLTDIATPGTRAALYTVNYWLMNAAFALGAAVGGFFYGAHFDTLLLVGLLLSAAVWTVTFTKLSETRPAGTPPSAAAGKGIGKAVRGYARAATDRVFLRLVLAAILITSVGQQLTYYLGIRLAADFEPQTLLHLDSWRVRLDGVGMLGLLRALNTVLVVALALVIGRLLRRLPETARMYTGIAMYITGFMGLAVTGDAWCLIALSVVYTVGELMHVPVRQALMADLVDPDHRSKYMALYGLRTRAAGLAASLSVIIGSVVPPVGMALLFGVFGIASALLLRVPVRVREERRSAAAAAPIKPTSSTRPN
ncbi:MFS transporter [Streptomyces sp. NPDC048384]|uniref:MFS transporter n=1 Tax=unclassified Streptomyces TaxID=2593676 RepID=UPI00343D48B4